MTEKIVDVNLVEYGNYSAFVGITESYELVIAQPTIEILMGWEEKSYRKKIASKSLKDFAGDGFNSAKIKLSNTFHYKSATNFVYYGEFLTVVKWQAKLGNMQAINILVAGFADSFSDFAYKAFGLTLTEKQRQQWLKDRQEGKENRRTLTDSIKDYLLSHPRADKKLYPIVTDLIYLGIFNRRAAELKADWNETNPRDEMTRKELSYVSEVESLTSRLIDRDGLHPLTAAKEALARLIIPVCDR